LLLRRLRHENRKTKVTRHEKVLYALALLGLICFCYAYAVEPYWPEITHVEIRSAKLPAGSRSIRIVHFSDLHSDGKDRLESRLPELVRAEHPDLIFFTGDTVVNRAGVPLARRVFTELSTIAPVYAVAGNWDDAVVGYWRGNIRSPDYFKGTGVHYLYEDLVVTEVGGTRLWIAGVDFDEARRIPALLEKVPVNEFSVLLHHTPDEVDAARQYGIDLYCAGHTHGGQIALPLYGALITYSRYDKKYERGLHQLSPSSWLYVNRGIGLEGHPPKARFFARPEITVIEISAASN
jgi:predicted MPP superfamily phosphohydrolase